jgi:hypothetical protein
MGWGLGGWGWGLGGDFSSLGFGGEGRSGVSPLVLGLSFRFYNAGNVTHGDWRTIHPISGFPCNRLGVIVFGEVV